MTVFWVLLALAARAEDPTRPPTGFVEKPLTEAPGQAPAVETPPQVAAVFLLSARPYALVDNQVVRVGDKLGGGRVSRIDEHGVWLKTAAGIQQLKLLPDVKKTPAGRKEKP
jgi:hypothetical protein